MIITYHPPSDKPGPMDAEILSSLPLFTLELTEHFPAINTLPVTGMLPDYPVLYHLLGTAFRALLWFKVSSHHFSSLK